MKFAITFIIVTCSYCFNTSAQNKKSIHAVLSSLLFFLNKFAQNKNSIQVALTYPLSLGNNFLNNTFHDIIGVDLGYHILITKNFALGPYYQFSFHSYKTSLMDASGNVTQNNLFTLFLHSLDAKARWNVNPENRFNISIDLSAGYSIANSG